MWFGMDTRLPCLRVAVAPRTELVPPRGNLSPDAHFDSPILGGSQHIGQQVVSRGRGAGLESLFRTHVAKKLGVELLSSPSECQTEVRSQFWPWEHSHIWARGLCVGVVPLFDDGKDCFLANLLTTMGETPTSAEIAICQEPQQLSNPSILCRTHLKILRGQHVVGSELEDPILTSGFWDQHVNIADQMVCVTSFVCDFQKSTAGDSHVHFRTTFTQLSTCRVIRCLSLSLSLCVFPLQSRIPT